jgi:hypothetical protein
MVLVAGLFSCRETKRDSVREFIPGIYIRYSEHEFGHEYDTLVITLLNESVGKYSILRKWKYERVLDGKWLEPEYKRTETPGLYNPQQQLLRDMETGAIYSFDVDSRVALNGPVKYQKL